jgi:hypothetical protein
MRGAGDESWSKISSSQPAFIHSTKAINILRNADFFLVIHTCTMHMHMISGRTAILHAWLQSRSKLKQNFWEWFFKFFIIKIKSQSY